MIDPLADPVVQARRAPGAWLLIEKLETAKLYRVSAVLGRDQSLSEAARALTRLHGLSRPVLCESFPQALDAADRIERELRRDPLALAFAGRAP
jgi:hypothetical protein